jgi:hypothetical protein
MRPDAPAMPTFKGSARVFMPAGALSMMLDAEKLNRTAVVAEGPRR